MRLTVMIFGLSILLTGCEPATPNKTDLSNIADPIERVRLAYKIDRLKSAKTIRMEDHILQDFPNHEYSSDFHEISAQRRYHVLDLENKKASSEYLTKITSNYYHGRNVLVDGKSRFIIYPSAIYQDQGDMDFMQEYGRVLRSWTPMLALYLDKSSETSRSIGQANWLGELHDTVTYDFPHSPPLTIFVQKDTGYISKMSRKIGETLVSYTYLNHQIKDGIPVAQEHYLYGGTERLFFSLNRNMELNRAADNNIFEVEPDITLEPERVDQSEMTVEAVTDHTIQAGQEDVYTSFFKTSEGLVAFAAEAGFAERLSAYRAETSDMAPLRYVVVANLHNDKFAGAADAAEAGATLLVTPDAEPRVRNILETDHPNANIERVSTSKSIGDLTIYNIATSTAAENLVAYHAVDGSLVQSAHYAIPFKETSLLADHSSYALAKQVEDLGLSPKILISSESRRTEDWNEFQKVIDNFVHTPCARGRRICDGWQ